MSAQDPIQRPPTTSRVWSETTAARGVADLVWMGDERLLIQWEDGGYQLCRYRRPADAKAEPFPSVVEGSWASKGFDHSTRLLSLGQGRVLEWKPLAAEEGGATRSSWRLWRWTPDAKDPLGSKPLAASSFGSIGSRKRMLYLGNDRVLAWEPTSHQSAGVNLFRVVRDPVADADPLPSHGNWGWDDIGHHHEVSLLSPDRLMAWEPATGRFRVFEVDRSAVLSSEPVFNRDVIRRPALAEGSWPDIRTDKRTQTLGWSLATEGRRLMPIDGRLLDFQPANGQLSIWSIRKVERVAEGPVAGLAGVSVKGTGDAAHLEVDLARLFAGDFPPKVARARPDDKPGIAERLGIPPDDVMADLLGRRDNEHVVDALAAERNLPQRTWQARREKLLDLGIHLFKPKPPEGRYGYAWETIPRYDEWAIAIKDKPVHLRITRRVLSVIDVAGHQRSHSVRMEALTPRFQALQRRLDDPGGISKAVIDLTAGNETLEQYIAAAAEELGVLTSLQDVLGLMKSDPRDPEDVGDDDRAKMDKLDKALADLIAKHKTYTVDDPIYDAAAFAKQRRDGATKTLLAAIEDPGLLELASELVDNLDVAPRTLVCRMYDTCRAAYTELLRSPALDHVMETHLRPTMAHVSRVFDRTFEGATFLRTGNKLFDEQVAAKEPEPTFTPDSLLLRLVLGKATDLAGLTRASSLAPVSSLVLPVAGNAPGPASLMGGVLTLAAPALMLRTYSDPQKAYKASSALFKNLAWLAGFTKAEADEALALTKSRELLEVEKAARIREKFSGGQAGPKWTAFLFVLNVIVFLNAVKAKEHDTYDEWLAIVNTGAAAAGSTSQALQHVSRVMTLQKFSKAFELGGKVVGMVGAAVAAYIAVKAYMVESDKHDPYGKFLAGANAVGGVLSFYGLVLTSCGLALPGAALMFVGAALSIGSSIASYVRDKTSTSAHAIFKVDIEEKYFNGFVVVKAIDEDGQPKQIPIKPFAWSMSKQGEGGELHRAFKAVASAHSAGLTGWMPKINGGPLTSRPRPADPRILPTTGAAALYDYGFPLETIAKLLGYDWSKPDQQQSVKGLIGEERMAERRGF